MRFWICSALCAVVSVACSAAEKPVSAVKKAESVVAEKVWLAKETSPKRYVGTVEAAEEVDIVPRVTGELREICFTEGGNVKKGDLLYVLEDTAYRAAVEGLRAQKEQLEASLRYASTEYRRSTRLLASKAVAVSSHDKALLEIETARAKIKEISASLLNAENNLSYTRIHAAISGRIGKSSVTVGNLLTPQGGKIANIAMISPIQVRFSLSERVFRRDFGGMDGLRKNAVVRVKLADGSMFGENGKIVLIDNKIGTTTNTVTVWAAFENKKREGGLLPGGFVTVLVSVRPEKPVPAVTPSSLMMEDGGYYVYVLDKNNRVSRRNVVTGALAGKYRTILKGLDGTETVIVDGTHKVSPGDTATFVSPESMK